MAKVTVYTSPTCGFCHMLKEYLTSKKVEFTEKDITQDKEAFDYVLNTIGQAATPVTDIGGEVVLGFDRPKIDLALRDKKLV
jgi:glutaredoxin-like YruB-family protein